MTKLTLPIQIGKKYRRRDGVEVVAKKSHEEISEDCAYVGLEREAECDAMLHAYKNNGRISMHGTDELDLIADAEEQETPQTNPHAEKILQYAQDWMETAEPWTRWESIVPGYQWVACETHPQWFASHQYRRKLKTIRIGDFDVPEPERVAPGIGMEYFAAAPAHDDFFVLVRWRGNDIDKRFLSRRFIHLTKEAAELHSKALISLIEKK